MKIIICMTAENTGQGKKSVSKQEDYLILQSFGQTAAKSYCESKASF